MENNQVGANVASSFDSPTFTLDMSIRVDQPVGSMSISPCGRDVVLASRQGLHIIDLDSPYSPPRHLPHRTPWEVADVQWSPFAVRDYWVISTSNQKALVWNLAMAAPYNAIEHVLHAHTRAITDINFSAHHPDVLATCAVDSFVHCWDLRIPIKPSMTFCDWFAGATQVKWNRQDPHIIASSHDKFLRIWDNRKGAYPLRSIEAHDTKIYGIDWNRTRPSAVVTCSLDKSIKFWDYSKSEDEPERVIRTPFPVWRSRHTPFGSGMLAMPQREDCDLHLYDRRLEEGMPMEDTVPPVHKFQGHQNQVKEFLWRPRGTITDGVDHREFQLVSWGTDRDLHLHRIDDDTLQKVGYQKGEAVRKSFNFTRRNAIYKSFREEKPNSGLDSQLKPTTRAFMHDQGFSSALGGALSAAMKKAPIPLSRGWADGGFMTSRTGKEAKRRTKREVTAIEWLKGIRVGVKAVHRGFILPSSLGGPRSRPDPPPLHQGTTWDVPESLGDEITQVADKFKKVRFEEVNIPKRSVAISMNGPWGDEAKMVYIQVIAQFPEDYPEATVPVFKLEKTSSITEETLSRIAHELKTIAGSYVAVKRGCLEGVLCYLLGELDLENSTAWLFGDREDDLPPNAAPVSHSSSDDEDDSLEIPLGIQAQDMESSGTEHLVASNATANVPLPKECGAVFAANGQLVCFFPPKKEKIALFGSDAANLDDERWLKGWRVFQGFGRLEGSPVPKGKVPSSFDEQDEDYESDTDSFETSSSSSGSSTEGLIEPPFSHFASWRAKLVRNQRVPRALSNGYSQRSTGNGSAMKEPSQPKPKNVVSLRNVDDILPTKRILAEQYVIFGDETDVCEQNAIIASTHGLDDIADVWRLAKLLLQDERPLETLEQPNHRRIIKMITRQATGELRKVDSGLDLSFDETEHGLQPNQLGRFRWGQHPLGGRWLVSAMFNHFEQVADVQMLGMLAYIFDQSSAQLYAGTATLAPYQQEISTPFEEHALSSSNLTSAEMNTSLLHSSISIPTITQSEIPSGTYSSGASSCGPSSTGPNTSYSTSTTPPLTYKSRRMSLDLTDYQPHSLSVSPEHPSRRSNYNFSSGLSSGLVRQLSPGPSSPLGGTGAKRQSPVESMLGNLPTSGVTWGQNTVFSPPVQEKFPSSELTYTTESEDDEENISLVKNAAIKVSMKNGSKFDGERSGCLPLLDPKEARRFRGYVENYADLLSTWNLELRRLELLKLPGHRMQRAESQPGESVMSLGKKRIEGGAYPISKDLYTLGHCAICGDILQRDGRGPSRRSCKRCKKIQNRLNCDLCNEAVQGIVNAQLVVVVDVRLPRLRGPSFSSKSRHR
ncbi:MAG: hypothetical protein M1837_000917 [Sclerophora amabilis]|nr:MAG: hypothetical protein M1837_000917 [Sclerophora amabilis]